MFGFTLQAPLFSWKPIFIFSGICMKISGQLHALATLLPGKEPQVFIMREVGWTLEPVWSWW